MLDKFSLFTPPGKFSSVPSEVSSDLRCVFCSVESIVVLQLRDEKGGFQEGQTQCDAVEHASRLCVYKRAWHLNRTARKRKRRAEVRHSFDSLKRILNVEGHDMSVGDVLLRVRHTEVLIVLVMSSLDNKTRRVNVDCFLAGV